jgi:hypothetical protein
MSNIALLPNSGIRMSLRALCIAIGVVFVTAAMLSLYYGQKSPNVCQPFAIGVSAIGGPDHPIGGCPIKTLPRVLVLR